MATTYCEAITKVLIGRTGSLDSLAKDAIRLGYTLISWNAVIWLVDRETGAVSKTGLVLKDLEA